MNLLILLFISKNMCKTIENWIPTDQPPWNCKNTLSLIQARSFLRICCCMNGYCYLGGNTHTNTMSDHGVIVILSDMNRRTTLKSPMVALNTKCNVATACCSFPLSLLFCSNNLRLKFSSHPGVSNSRCTSLIKD